MFFAFPMSRVKASTSMRVERVGEYNLSGDLGWVVLLLCYMESSSSSGDPTPDRDHFVPSRPEASFQSPSS